MVSEVVAYDMARYMADVHALADAISGFDGPVDRALDDVVACCGPWGST